jgi:hypothetical protein
MTETCALCLYWAQWTRTSKMGESAVPIGIGRCHRHPPSGPVAGSQFGMVIRDGVVIDPGHQANSHPVTRGNDWCGEWRPANPS